MFDKLRVKYSKKWCLVDLLDQFVMYQGTYDQCFAAIETVYGGCLGIIHERHLTYTELKSLYYLIDILEENNA